MRYPNNNPGAYHLIIHLAYDVSITVGKLGNFHFSAGYYVYTGSALRGLEVRILRHLQQEKRLHWHIDYLLQHAKIIHIVKYQTKERLECYLNNQILMLPECKIPVKGFGSSDCKCISHLAYFENKPNKIIAQDFILEYEIAKLIKTEIES